MDGAGAEALLLLKISTATDLASYTERVRGGTPLWVNAVALGFDGKTLIHPSQEEPRHAAFAPSAKDLRWAEAIRVAFDAPDAQGMGATRVEGRMVERLRLDQALRVLPHAGG